jgi:tRNA (mo5U34)-methyltransferase
MHRPGLERRGGPAWLGENRAGAVNDPLAYIREWRERFLQIGWWHSFELPDGSVIEGVSDLAAQKLRLAQFPIPGDLTGKRVLDIGAWDGWFSFEMERRGAEVVAIDRFDNPRFHEIRERLGSRVDYRQIDIYDVNPRTLGCFDLVLFLGVFYHLKHPLLALERVCSVTREMAAVESFVISAPEGSYLQFFERDEFGGQADNWFAPTVPALISLCRAAGFARAGLANRGSHGAAITCRRQWDASVRHGPPVEIFAAANVDDFGINFRSEKDEYVTCVVRGAADALFPEVGPYGVGPVLVKPLESGATLVNFRLPPGLSPGWHEVRMGNSNAVPIAVDLETATDRIEIKAACDGLTWKPGEVSSGFVSLWVNGLPDNADIANVELSVAGRRQTVTFVGPADAAGQRQVNARVDAPAGPKTAYVSVGATRSNTIDLV